MDKILRHVRDFADKAHGEQMRKYSPERYIVHPERVMHLTQQVTDDPAVLSAALLHDVLEDTPVTEQEVREFLRELMSPNDVSRTMQFVRELTNEYTKNKYPQWNRRKRKSREAERLARSSPEAQTIKYADIIDNCPEIVREEPDFGNRYVSECIEMLRKMKKGNAELHQQAMDAVSNARQQLNQASAGL